MRLIPKTAVGIEIAGRDLRIAVVRDFFGKRRLVRVDVATGFLDLSEEDRLSAITNHFKKNKLSGLNVHLTFPGSWGVTRELEFPATAGLEMTLRSAVALQIENLSPWSLDEIYWDCCWEPVTKGTRSVIVHVGVVPCQVVDPWIGLFRSAGLALTGASLSSLSWAHGLIAFWGPERPAMAVAVEREYVEGALVRNGHLYAIGMDGGDSTTQAAACASHVMRNGRVDSIEELRIIAHGSSASQLGLPAAQLPIQGPVSEESVFGSVCSALLGLARTSFRLNLIPVGLRYQRNRLQTIPTYALVLLLILVGIAAWLREPYQQSLYASRLDQEAKRLAVEVRPLADQEVQLNRATDRLKAINALVANRDGNLEALREFSRLLGPGTFLTSYTYQDKVITISGVSDGAAAIQKAMETSPLFHDAQFTSAITRDSTGKDRFTMRVSVEVKR